MKGSYENMIGFGRRGTAEPSASMHHNALRRFFARRVPKHDIDDLVQETMTRAMAAGTDGEVADVERYLFRTARNVLIDRHRSAIAEQAAHDQVAMIDGSEVGEITPERIIIAREELARMRQVVLGMPERTRTAFLLRRFENLRYQEIADLMGISTNSVKSLLHRAIAFVGAEQTEMDRRDA